MTTPTQQVIIRRTVATTAELKAGPLQLGLGQWGFATTDSILVARDLSGNFHEIMSDGAIKQYIDGNCLVKSPVNTIYDLPDGEVDGTMRMVLETGSYHYVSAGAWIKIAKPGDETPVVLINGELPIIVAGTSPTVISHSAVDGYAHIPSTVGHIGQFLIPQSNDPLSAEWATPDMDMVDQGVTSKKLSDVEYAALTGGGNTTLHTHAGDRGTTYTFASSLTWVIVHNRGYYPTISLAVGGKKVMADIVDNSVNQATVTFTVAKAGTARVH